VLLTASMNVNGHVNNGREELRLGLECAQTTSTNPSITPSYFVHRRTPTEMTQGFGTKTQLLSLYEVP
jgi:hypothetical protein